MRSTSYFYVLILWTVSFSSYASEKLKFEALAGSDQNCLDLASDLTDHVKLDSFTAPESHKAGEKLVMKLVLSKTKKLESETWLRDYSFILLDSIINKPYEKFVHHGPQPSLADFFFEDADSRAFNIETDVAINIGGKAFHRLSLDLRNSQFRFCSVRALVGSPLEILSEQLDITPPLVRSISYDKISYRPGEAATVTFKFSEPLKTLTSDHIDFTNKAIAQGEAGRSIPKYGETHKLKELSKNTYSFTFQIPEDTKQGSYHPDSFNRFDGVDNFEAGIGGEDFYEKQVAETSPLVVSIDNYPLVDKDISHYRAVIQEKKDKFDQLPVDPQNKEWIKAKLSHMYDVDQFTREYLSAPSQNSYSEDEAKYFWAVFVPIWLNLDFRNTEDLKDLLKIWDWFNISSFGAQTDNFAWIIVQHADHDTEFQKETLVKLEKLYPKGETSPKNYAYLYDRVAASWQKPDLRRLQRYGTQGQCKEAGKWEPLPIENPERVDERRRSVGLGTMQEYIFEISKVCK